MEEPFGSAFASFSVGLVNVEQISAPCLYLLLKENNNI